MKYAFQMFRNTRTGHVQIGPVLPVPNGTKPSYTRRPGSTEALTVYPTREEAENIRNAELLVQEYSHLSDEERREILENAIKASRMSVPLLSDVTKLSKNTLSATRAGIITPHPRLVAKIVLLARELDRVYRAAPLMLPAADPTGNATMGRGGRKDIWRSNKWVKAKNRNSSES